ncbi:hypothetical protein [Saccharothrix sp. ST-888]|uniref:hypothetical protein n=1 Tax=Saccharothrix sp. ST-888 TaxID=1427391 RepID=UPI00069741B3|nr:hypothetical protein [Saccharothrix sp. ST-888]
MAEWYRVDPEALKQTAAGINDAIGELKSIGMVEGAEVGRGFTHLELTGVQAGSQDVKAVFDEFCERWSWGVRALVQTGTDIAEKLHLSAGLYNDQEQYVSGVAKDVANAALGNPDLTREQVEGRSWGRTLADNPFTQVRDADYSAKSYQDAAVHTAATWKSEEADLLSNSQLQAMAATAGDLDGLATRQAKAAAAGKDLNEQYAKLTGGGG